MLIMKPLLFVLLLVFLPDISLLSQQECYTHSSHARSACFDFVGNISTTSNYTFGPVTASNTPIKSIRCIVHVVRRGDGSDNFQNTSSHKSIISGVFSDANSVFSGNKALSHAGPCASVFLNDSRIRLSISKYVFHENDDLFCAGSPNSNPGACDFYSDLVTDYSGLTSFEKNNSLHIFIIGCRIKSGNEFHAPGGYAAGIPTKNENFIVVKSWYHFLVTNNGQEELEIAQNLAHEVGHTVGLYHSFLNDHLCDTYDGNQAQTNNVMDYKQDKQEALSRRQIERMHYFLLGHSNTGDIKDVNASSISKPTPTISGPSAICSNGGVFHVSNHQLGTFVSWSVSPSNAVTNPTGDGSEVTLMPTGYTGSATITFNVDYGAYGTRTGSHSFTISQGITGTVSSGGQTQTMQGSGSFDVTSTNVIANIDAPGATSFTWTKTCGTGTFLTQNSGKKLTLYMVPGGYTCFNVTTTNSSCGTLSATLTFYHVGSNYSFYPNPTNGDLWVEADKDKKIKIKDKDGIESTIDIKPGIDQITLLDKEGHFIKGKKLPNKTKKGKISLDGLKPDVYIVVVKDGNVLIEEKIIKN